MLAEAWDYVVVVAGGCVVAGRLSQMVPQARIAVIGASRKHLAVSTKVSGIAFIARGPR